MPYFVNQSGLSQLRGNLGNGNPIRNRSYEQLNTQSGNPMLPIFNTPKGPVQQAAAPYQNIQPQAQQAVMPGMQQPIATPYSQLASMQQQAPPNYNGLQPQGQVAAMGQQSPAPYQGINPQAYQATMQQQAPQRPWIPVMPNIAR